MAEVASRGAPSAAIEQGYQKGEIERAAYAVAQEVDSGERIVVGVNRFAIGAEDAVRAAAGRPGHRGRPGGEPVRLRAGRDESAVQQALAEVRAVAAGTANLLPALNRHSPGARAWARCATPCATSGASTTRWRGSR